MDNAITVNGIIRFVESRVKGKVNYEELEQAMGFSYRHLREEFKAYTNVSLKRYINSRKLAHTAFEMETSDRSLLEIATEYGFEAYDSFTRLFHRELGITPANYRRNKCYWVERGQLAMGTYGPVIHNRASSPQRISTGLDQTGILYGVPELGFFTGKCIPFPACLESVLAYKGQRHHASYWWIASASGAAFRFCWNPGQWDLANPDLRNLYPESPLEAYRRIGGAAGWSCRVLPKAQITKARFFAHVMESVDRGDPLIAIGIVGPPEACVLTGYDRSQEKLLGWSFFQGAPELAPDVQLDASGYFVTQHWWENLGTTGLVLLEEKQTIPSDRELLQGIYRILTRRRAGIYHTGQLAYQSWAKDLLDDSAFAQEGITTILLNRFYCQADAETMVGEGRYWGARFFQELAARRNDTAEICAEIAGYLEQISNQIQQMTVTRKGGHPTEEAVRALCDRAVRLELARTIEQVRQTEQTVIGTMEKLLRRMEGETPSKTSR